MTVFIQKYDEKTKAEFTTFGNYIVSLGAAPASIIIGTDVLLFADLEIPSNVEIFGFTKQAKFTSSDNTQRVLTINRMTADPLAKIFDSTISAYFSQAAVKHVRPEWWGAKGDGLTDDTYAVQQAINNGVGIVVGSFTNYSNHNTKLLGVTYAIYNTLTIPNRAGYTLEGVGKSLSSLVWKGTPGGTLMVMRGNLMSRICDLWLNGGNNHNSVADEALGADIVLDIVAFNPLVDSMVSHNNRIERCRIDNTRAATTAQAIRIGDPDSLGPLGTVSQLDALVFDGCFIVNSYRLVRIGGNVTFDIEFNKCIFSPYNGGTQLKTLSVTSGNPTVPMASTAGILVGQSVYGTGILASTTVTSIVTDTSVTLSSAPTVTDPTHIVQFTTGIVALSSIEVRNRCANVRAIGCQFLGGIGDLGTPGSVLQSCPSDAHIVRDKISGGVFINGGQTETSATLFHGEDDTGFQSEAVFTMSDFYFGYNNPPIIRNFSIDYSSDINDAIGTTTDLNGNFALPYGITLFGTIQKSIETFSSTSCTTSSTAGLAAGMYVIGAGINQGTIITGISSSTDFTISLAATSSSIFPATFISNSVPLGIPKGTIIESLDGEYAFKTTRIAPKSATATLGYSVYVDLGDTSTLASGMTVTGDGVPNNTVIVSIDSSFQITLSNTSTIDGPTTLSFSFAGDIAFVPSAILYKQHGSVALWNGDYTTYNYAVFNFSPGGTPGGSSGLAVTSLSGKYQLIDFISARGALLNRVDTKGNLSYMNGRFSVDSAGNSNFGGSQMVLRGDAYIGGLIQMNNNNPLNSKKTDGNVATILNYNAAGTLDVGPDVEKGLTFYAGGGVTIGAYDQIGTWALQKGVVGSSDPNDAGSGVAHTVKGGTTDDTLNRLMSLVGGASGARTQFCTETTSAVGVTPKKIAGIEFSSFILVNGVDGNASFMDILLASTIEVGPAVVFTYTTSTATPAARTYTRSASDIMLSMASGSYGINCFWIQLSTPA